MTALLFSCECATCAIPEAHRELFRDSEEIVTSHEGWEPGALNLAQAFSMKFRTPLVHSEVTRLLIDLAMDGDARWSRFSQKLPETTRAKLVERHEKPYRATLRQRIAEDLRRHSSVLHVMVHTDDATDGELRLETSPGAFLAEKLAARWLARLTTGDLQARHVSEASSSALSLAMEAEFPPDAYAQIRFRISQSFFLSGRPWKWETVKKFTITSLAEAMDCIN